MRILAYDAGTRTINLYDTSLFRKLGTNGFYIASWYQSKLYNPHIHPDVKFIVGGKEYKAGNLFADNEASFIPKRITDYVQRAITPAVEDDIVTPSHWDCMEGRQLSIFFDCLSRHDGKENLYVLARGTNAPSLTRNEYCMNYTPTKDSTDFALTVRRLDEEDCHTVSSKPVQVRVHHKLKDKLTKNICICGDSLVDNGLNVQSSAYRDEDGNPTSTRKRSLKLTPELIAEAPDLLHFEKGIYCAFIEKETVKGDVVEFKTTFGVTLTTVGNRRTLNSFRGFKRCNMDGTVEYVDAPYKVYGFSIQYRRYLTMAAKRERKDAV